MTARRGATSLSGILAVDKPSGPTSHDVVAAVRRAIGERRVGHAGTLDPLATGLLLVLVGPATRLEPFLSGHDKTYLARITFGTATDTDDAQGQPIRTAPVPSTLFEPSFAADFIASLIGRQSQQPPAFSALKVGGQTAHRVARAGGRLPVADRDIEVRAAELVAVNAADAAWDVRFSVSKGTYVRSLARDIGERVGSAAHLSALRRLAIGTVGVDQAHTLQHVLRAAASTGGVEPLFADPVRVLGLPAVTANDPIVAVGRPLPGSSAPDLAPGAPVAVVTEMGLRAVYRVSGDLLRPAVVLAAPAEARHA